MATAMPRRLRNHVAAHHLVDHAVLVRLGNSFRGHVPAIEQYRDGVAQLENFLHAMRHVNDRDAALFQLAEQLK